MGPYKNVNGTVYIENGTKSVHLPCGDIPENAYGIEWEMYKSQAWKRILKFYLIQHDQDLNHFYNYDTDKYGISDSDNTSLVVNNINISDIGLFRCRTVGEYEDYRFTTFLQVVGKLLSV